MQTLSFSSAWSGTQVPRELHCTGDCIEELQQQEDSLRTGLLMLVFLTEFTSRPFPKSSANFKSFCAVQLSISAADEGVEGAGRAGGGVVQAGPSASTHCLWSL